MPVIDIIPEAAAERNACAEPTEMRRVYGKYSSSIRGKVKPHPMLKSV
jgi:hypothetical protein